MYAIWLGVGVRAERPFRNPRLVPGFPTVKLLHVPVTSIIRVDCHNETTQKNNEELKRWVYSALNVNIILQQHSSYFLSMPRWRTHRSDVIVVSNIKIIPRTGRGH